jgi:hypothetical protein
MGNANWTKSRKVPTPGTLRYPLPDDGDGRNGFGRSGYGLDLMYNLGGGQFRGGKGGLLDTASSAVYFDGDWGYVMVWGSGIPGQPANEAWTWQFPAVMNVAQNTKWGAEDLFPQFGMPSL